MGECPLVSGSHNQEAHFANCPMHAGLAACKKLVCLPASADRPAVARPEHHWFSNAVEPMIAGQFQQASDEPSEWSIVEDADSAVG